MVSLHHVLASYRGLPVARITLRLDDGVHDRLLRHAHHHGISLSALIRPAIEGLAHPSRVPVPTGQQLQLGVQTCTLMLLLLDIEARAPHLLGPGARSARELLRCWELPEELVDNILVGWEHRHAR